MSFQGSGFLRFTVKGQTELIAANNAIIREMPQTKMAIHREASTFFVQKAKERVHKVSGDLARSIEVESITPQQAIVSANMPYARIEEERPGTRKTPPGTKHAYMKPAAADTSLQMPKFIRKGFDELLRRHQTRVI